MARRSGHHRDEPHHGGAWKVAYADFVTAMMAFFLMMWLLNATTEDQRRGLADYFSPEIPISSESGGGDGVLAGDSVAREDTLPDATTRDEGTTIASSEAEFDVETLQQDIEDKIEQMGERGGHIAVRPTDEGLVVDLFALENAPLFQSDSARPTPLMRDLISVVDEVFALAENSIAIGGFVASDPIVLRDTDPWSLSADRAERVRGMLAEGQTGPERQARVTAHADRSPLHPDRLDPRNNRIELILLRNR